MVGEDIPWYLSNGSLGVSLLLLILAQVLSYGVRLQTDLEGLARRHHSGQHVRAEKQPRESDPILNAGSLV